MKPSERDPTACLALVELLQEAGMPPGVVNVIHGQHDSVNFICDHPDIRAISFVGKRYNLKFRGRAARVFDRQFSRVLFHKYTATAVQPPPSPC